MKLSKNIAYVILAVCVVSLSVSAEISSSEKVIKLIKPTVKMLAGIGLMASGALVGYELEGVFRDIIILDDSKGIVIPVYDIMFLQCCMMGVNSLSAIVVGKQLVGKGFKEAREIMQS
jgi:hypothetical protein